MATPERGVHALRAEDEAKFLDLLRAVYGETYSHRSLYRPGGLKALLDEQAILWGEFDERGELVGHTGFLRKDPRGDYSESGLSFARPGRVARRVRSDFEGRALWPRLLASANTPLVHQHTTTWHPLAQRYAERYLGAKLSGFVFAYTVGERLEGFVSRDVMDAVALTSVVTPLPPRAPAMVPEGPMADWLCALFDGFGRPTLRIPSGTRPTPRFRLETFERSEGLDLVRRVVVRSEATTLEPTGNRTDLVHLPTDDRVLAFHTLSRSGYVPVGIRIHATRPDELVFQRLSGHARTEAFTRLTSPETSLVPSIRPHAARWVELARGIP
jgi:hypothetical protein